MSEREVEEQTHTNTPGLATRYRREVGRARGAGGRPRSSPPTCRTQTPQHSAGIRAPGVRGSPAGRAPPSPAPHHHTPAGFFSSCYLCSEEAQLSPWKRCLLPRTAWDLGPALGLRVSGPNWEQVGGRVSRALPLFGCFGPQPQPGRKAPGGGRARQLWPLVQWENDALAGSDQTAL